MRPDGVERALGTIDYNITLARQFVQGTTLEDFETDERTLYAVTRCLEIISEASRRPPDAVRSRHPDVPWRLVAGAGTVYCHDYDDLLPRILWAHRSGPTDALEHAVRAELERIAAK